MECPQCHYVLEPFEQACPRCTRRGAVPKTAPAGLRVTPAPASCPSSSGETPGNAFRIHPGFRHQLITIIALSLIGLLVGSMFIWMSFNVQYVWVNGIRMNSPHPLPSYTPACCQVFGVLAIIFNVWGLYSALRQVWRASAVLHYTHPMPALVTITAKGNWEPRNYRPVLATIQPANPAVISFRTVIDMPVYLGEYVLPGEPLTQYADTSCELYLSTDPDDPVVFCVEGKCWCSRKDFRGSRT